MVIMIQAYIDMLAQRIQAHKQKAMVKRARQRQRESIMGNNNIQKVCSSSYLEHKKKLTIIAFDAPNVMNGI
tara:strand:- start:455 stop:670 length:216 start_codon:yes stop_codon:yes gene_type:complete